jgi:hypothetical protein
MAYIPSIRSAFVSEASIPNVCRACRHRYLSLSQHRRSISTSTRLEQHEGQSNSYEPAKYWDGLEWIGTKNWVYERSKPVMKNKLYDMTLSNTMHGLMLSP